MILRELWSQYAAELARVGRPPARTHEAWEPWARRRLAAGDVRVGMDSGRIVAYIVWEVRRAPEGGRRLEVDELYVAPELRGQRLGSGLLARALDRARALGLATVQMDGGLGDEAVAALLAQFGFEERGGCHVRSLLLG